jgi:outer membrane receptor protein involved in Fe transport
MVFNLVGGKEFTLGTKKNKILGFNVKGVYAGGQRYTQVDIVASQNQGKTIYIEEQRFKKQSKPYFRIDLGMSYRINKTNVAHVFAFDIQNATNYKNIRGIYYNLWKNQPVYSYGVGFVPVLSYKIEF